MCNLISISKQSKCSPVDGATEPCFFSLHCQRLLCCSLDSLLTYLFINLIVSCVSLNLLFALLLMSTVSSAVRVNTALMNTSIFDIPHFHLSTHSNETNKKCVSPYFVLISSCLSCISVLLLELRQRQIVKTTENTGRTHAYSVWIHDGTCQNQSFIFNDIIMTIKAHHLAYTVWWMINEITFTLINYIVMLKMCSTMFFFLRVLEKKKVNCLFLQLRSK